MKNEIVVATQIKDTYKFVELSINKAFGETIKKLIDARKANSQEDFENLIFTNRKVQETTSLDEITSRLRKTIFTGGIIFSEFKATLFYKKDNRLEIKDIPSAVAKGCFFKNTLINEALLKSDISKESTLAFVSFVELRRGLESVLNKFPKNEKFSTVQDIKDDLKSVYRVLGIFAYASKEDKKLLLKSFEEVFMTIQQLKLSFYLAYTQNFYYRCRNDGTKNRNVTETFDSLENRKGYFKTLGLFSSFLAHFYILIVKMFNHLEITKREETAEIIRSLSRKIKIVEDIKNEDGTIDTLEYLADLEKRIYQSKQENLIKELFE